MTYGEGGLGLRQGISSRAAGDLEVGVLPEGQGALLDREVAGRHGQGRGGQRQNGGDLGEVHLGIG